MGTGLTMPRAAQEQREGKRRAVLIRCRLQGSHDAVERFTRIADLGPGGARIFTATPPGVGELLAITFRLSSAGATVVTEARVVWRSEGYHGRGGVIGVEFVTVSDPDAVQRFLEGA